jgi:ribosomal peptide maturation radical SAM protein 1
LESFIEVPGALNHSIKTMPISPSRVALVNMPFSDSARPSIQCGLLKAVLGRAGIATDVLYLNLELAARIGGPTYRTIAQFRTEFFLGEWLFSVAAFGPRHDEAAYFEHFPGVQSLCREMNCDSDWLVNLRTKHLPALVDQWSSNIEWSQYAIVGFTSTFEQNCASFALARAIKRKWPAIKTIFGGANFDGEMGREFVRSLSFIDYIVTGEGDYVLPRLVEQILLGANQVDIQGVSFRTNDAVVDGGSAAPVENLDALPDPDYEEYFQTLAKLGVQRTCGDFSPVMLIETARGCWWGQKHHCTFCGLNANGMRFRSKSPKRVSSELQRLAARYGILDFAAVDNIIDIGYLDSLCGELSSQRSDYRIFYETKANLTRSQLRSLANAGIVTLQPGIESLSTNILRLMRKGTTALQNVRLMKWALYYGIDLSWNILAGFPGETAADYREQCRIVSLLTHLQPPQGYGTIHLDRFSPYHFDPAFPVKNVKPRAAYWFVYPDKCIDIDKIAYFFDHSMDFTLPVTQYDPLYGLLAAWKAKWLSKPVPKLTYRRCPDWMRIHDTRGECPITQTFVGQQAKIYEMCSESDTTPRAVARDLAAASQRDKCVSADEVHKVMEMFCKQGLMLEENGHYLSLALPAYAHW